MEEQHLRRALRPGPDCPSIERLGRYADGTLTAEERRGDESHVATCVNCQAELVLLQAFATASVRGDEADDVRWGVEQLARRQAEIF
jgi:anti-sigma factor RsiW